MAVIQLCDSWSLADYGVIYAVADKDEPFDSPFLPALEHFAYRGLKWQLQVFPRGADAAKPDYATVAVYAVFGREKCSATSVWAKWALTVLAKKTSDNKTVVGPLKTFLPLFPDENLGMDFDYTGVFDTFSQDYLSSAVKDNGCLQLNLDLEIYKIIDILECRGTVRSLLSENSLADFIFKVDRTNFRVHKAILAPQGGGFVELFQGDSNGAVLADTKTDAFAAFVSALYCENFEFLSDWKLTVGVLKLSSKFGVAYLKGYCDDALAELMPTLGVDIVFQVLLAVMHCGALKTKTICIRMLAEREDDLSSAEWIAFKATEDKRAAFSHCNLSLQNHRAAVSELFGSPPVCHAAEVTLRHTWAISNAELLRAIQSRATSIKSSAILKHKAFPGLEWQAEFFPRGNADDADFTPGYASLYLKPHFLKGDNGLKAAYAKWKWEATITLADGKKITLPGVNETRNGYANAVRCEQFNDDALQIELQLKIASVAEISMCRDIIRSLRPDMPYADVEFDVNGMILKAHKCILAARSAVFAKMFHTDMAENNSGKVEVKDTTPEAFEYFMAAVYYDSWDFLSDVDDTLDVLKLAERCAVLDLKRYCDEVLARVVDETNVFDVLIHAALHNADASKAACVRILFAKQGFAESDGWITFKKAVNKEIAFDIIEAISKQYRLADK